MKLLVFGDTHGSSKAMKSIREKAKNADLLLCIGDVTVFEQNFRSIMKQLDKLGKKMLMIHGNHEGESSMRKQCEMTKNVKFLHERMVEEEGYVIAGFGGGGFSLTDSEMKSFFLSLKKKIDDKPLIIMTHAPPYKTTLDDVHGSSCGCKTVRQVTEKLKPIYTFAGHLHENFGKRDQIGKSKLLNPGPFGMIITFPKV
jgi:Icc-related predicted phosphoesterase